MSDPFWTPERRTILRRAISKAQAGREQREPVRMNGEEGAALYDAARAWEDMMQMLDERAAAGDLQGLKP